MRLTKLDQKNIARFGCTFLAKRNIICIAGSAIRENAARSANINARLIQTEWDTGPLLCLAFEVSWSRALAQYCFLPLDLTQTQHKRFLARLLEKGKIELLLGEAGEVTHVHELPPYQRKGMEEIFNKTILQSDQFPSQIYDFDQSVRQFEQRARLVDYFQYIATDPELRQVITLCSEAAAKAAPEVRTQAAMIANELLRTFQPKYEFVNREFLAKIPRARVGLLFMHDVHRHFQGDIEGFSRFLTDIIAAHTPKEDYRKLETAALLFKLLFRLIDDVKPDGAQKDVGALEADFREIIARLAEGQGVSINALINLVSGVGIPLGGKPGRHARDYSREYEWKASGLSWTEVTRKSLAENPDMCAEFGGRDFDSLDFRQKEALKHRIEIGVKSYADRVGKPFPIEVLQRTPQKIS